MRIFRLTNAESSKTNIEKNNQLNGLIERLPNIGELKQQIENKLLD